MKLNRNLLVVVLLALAPMCFAPIEDKPKGAQFHGELSDAQLEAAQRGEVTAATPSSGSPQQESQETQVGAAPSDPEAGQVVANADADNVLKKAERDVKDQEGAKSRPIIVAGSVFLAVGALLFGAKVWLDKTVPPSGD